jgi:hypothetical protein
MTEVSHRAWALLFAASSLPASEPEAAGAVAMQTAVRQEAVCARVANVRWEREFAAEEQAQADWAQADLWAGWWLADSAPADCSAGRPLDDWARFGSGPAWHSLQAFRDEEHSSLGVQPAGWLAAELLRDSPERYKVSLPAWQGSQPGR